MGTSTMPSNIILITRGTKGDLYPFINIGQGFRKLGCNVTLLSNYCYESYAIKAGIEFKALDDRESFEIFNNMPKYYQNLPSLLALYKEHSVASIERELAIIGRIALRGDTTIVANSNHYLASIFAKEKFGITVNLSILAPSYIHGFALFEAFLRSLSNDLNLLRDRIGLPRVENWGSWLRNYDNCYGFWPSWFSDNINVNAIRHVGFLPVDKIEESSLQEEILDFLSSEQKCILMTHGSSKPFKDDFFSLGIDACETLKYKLIIITPFRDLLPPELPDNVFWSDFSPFHKLLSHVDLIIHHGGIGTAREAVATAIPQVIIGQGFDRQHNGRTIQSLGLGEWISPKKVNSEILIEVICNLLKQEQIIIRCHELNRRLYDDAALKIFYESVLTKSRQKTMLCTVESKANPKEFLLGDSCTNSQNLVASNMHEKCISHRVSLSKKKQKLLNQVLKNKDFSHEGET